jgi:hypothetical protein
MAEHGSTSRALIPLRDSAASGSAHEHDSPAEIGEDGLRQSDLTHQAVVLQFPKNSRPGVPQDAASAQQSVAGDQQPEGGSSARGPFTLANILGVDEAELAAPLPRIAPPEHRWEQLSLGVTPDTGEATAAPLRTGVATQPPAGPTELVPGANEPGAVEVPVYLASQTLSSMADGTGTDAPSALGSLLFDEPAPSAPAGDGVWHMPSVVTGTVHDPVYGADEDLNAPRGIQHPATRSEAASAIPRNPTPAEPSPTLVSSIKPKKNKKHPPPPAAMFGSTEFGPLMWPAKEPPKAEKVLSRKQCANCGSPLSGPWCTLCGERALAPQDLTVSGMWHEFVAMFFSSDSVLRRTFVALLIKPGELTDAYLTGRRSRYVRPLPLFLAACALFAVMSGTMGLRPRPDRNALIGLEREMAEEAGMEDLSIPGTSIPKILELPAGVRTYVTPVAKAVEKVPAIWLPMMVALVTLLVAGLRVLGQAAGRSYFVFASHFGVIFTFLWGVLMPIALVGTKVAFEFAAIRYGAGEARFDEEGKMIEAVPLQWNMLRETLAGTTFHSAALFVMLLPWTILAFRRAFDDGWVRATISGILVAAIPVLMLTPFR